MTDHISRVARAMSAALGEEPDGSNHTWDGSLILGINGPVEYKNWEGYKVAAKAAIAAHKAALEAQGLVIVPVEPTDMQAQEMQRAVYTCSMVPPSLRACTEEHARCLFKAMLAALEGKDAD